MIIKCKECKAVMDFKQSIFLSDDFRDYYEVFLQCPVCKDIRLIEHFKEE